MHFTQYNAPDSTQLMQFTQHHQAYTMQCNSHDATQLIQCNNTHAIQCNSCNLTQVNTNHVICWTIPTSPDNKFIWYEWISFLHSAKILLMHSSPTLCRCGGWKRTAQPPWFLFSLSILAQWPHWPCFSSKIQPWSWPPPPTTPPCV